VGRDVTGNSKYAGLKLLVQRAVIVLLIGSLPASCRFSYLVRIDGADVRRTLHTDCGDMAIQLRGRGDRKFSLSQTFYPSDTMYLLLDSVLVAHNGRPISPGNVHYREAIIPAKGLLRFEKPDSCRLDFEVPGGVFEGDTLWIQLRGALDCAPAAGWRFYFHFNRGGVSPAKKEAARRSGSIVF
jgi:hypothetical protein